MRFVGLLGGLFGLWFGLGFDGVLRKRTRIIFTSKAHTHIQHAYTQPNTTKPHADTPTRCGRALLRHADKQWYERVQTLPPYAYAHTFCVCV